MKLASGDNYIMVNEDWLRGLMAEAEQAKKNLEASEAIGDLDKSMAGLIFAPLQGHIASAESVISYSPVFEGIHRTQKWLGLVPDETN